VALLLQHQLRRLPQAVAVTAAASQDHQDLEGLRENPVAQENPVLPGLQEHQESHRLSHASPSLRHRASPAHLDPLDRPDPQDHRETLDPQASLEIPDKTHPQASQARRVHQANREHQDSPEPQESPEPPPNLLRSFPDPQDHREMPDRQEHQASPEGQEATVSQDQQAPRDPLDHLDPQETTANREHLVSQERLEAPERRVSARNTVPSTEESSSRTELVAVKSTAILLHQLMQIMVVVYNNSHGKRKH